MAKKKGMLVLEDGSTYVGDSLGAEGEWVGEVVFNTSMTGYQEIITDPSYWGQMVVFTCPHIGNVGVNDEDVESRQPFVRAVIARQICEQPSNWRAQRPLPEYLREAGVPALSGVDTRRITLTIREKGVMRGALSTEDLDAERLLDAARNAPDMSVLAAVDAVTCDEPFGWHEAVDRAWISKLSYDMSAPHRGSPHIVVVDCGTKHNIL
ncbi:MAG: carbamoyl phosphate synthase small subunit, partial [Chloroflexi bacterium]|nr:carbamoyl phosphate synthase small subunit [Chloroflexota bacterium]